MSDPSTAPSRLDGRVIMITGGSQGLGLATAKLCAGRGAAGLVLIARDPDKGATAAAALEAAGTPTLFVAADIGDPVACAAALAAADERFGVVHGLVNGAAVTDRGTVWDTTVELWDRLIAVNLRAPYLLIQGVARIMRREGVPGSIVNIGSVAGYGGQPFLFPYAASKGGLHALTRNAAFSLMPDHIRVNLLNLGWMDTPGEDVIQRKYHGATDTWLAEAEGRQPFGRLIKPAEAARTICYLLSDESGMLTGASIDFDQSVIGAGEPAKPEPRPVS